LSVSGKVTTNIKFNEGYGIQFYSPSGRGGHLGYYNGSLYVTREDGVAYAIAFA
jgi:hypothetical protein